MKQTIGLIGFGVVGQGVYELVSRRSDPGITIKKVCVRDRLKKRSLTPGKICYDLDEVLDDDEINLVVEVINDPDAACYIAEKALITGKSLVSANKKMVAERLPAFRKFLAGNGTAMLYEGSTCGSIPIIRNLEEYYSNDIFGSLSGILNGSANYILSRVFGDGMAYKEALSQAQLLGFAEADPRLDVSGEDTLSKLVILAVHSLGKWVDPSTVFCSGIQNLRPADIQYAASLGMKIRLTGNILRSGKGFSMFVIPWMMNRDNPLYHVENEYNAVVLEGEQCSRQVLTGKGAGRMPTATAVMSDIDARTSGYGYRYRKFLNGSGVEINGEKFLNIYLRTGNEEIIRSAGFVKKGDLRKSNGYYIFTGGISLSNLTRIRKQLDESGSFIALTGFDAGDD